MARSRQLALTCALLAGSAALSAIPAGAQDVVEPFYLALELDAVGPINSPITRQFDPGFSGAVAAFYSLAPEVALGVRVRAGFLSAGSMIPQDPVDRGMLDMGLVTPVLRMRPFGAIHETERRAAGFWLELAPGAGMSDGQVVFAYDAGMGYGFSAGPVAIGPAIHFTHFVETDGRFGGNQVLTWSGGLEVAFLDEAARIEPLPAPEPLPEPEPIAENLDLDGDGLIDDDQCPNEPETFNGVDDEDGCPDEGRVEFVNDALIVDERVFFDYDGVELRETGIRQLEAVVEHYRQWANHYERLVVAGHADSRGPEEYNVTLSRRRADAVRKYLTDNGVPDGVLDLQAYGESTPAIPEARTEWEHQVNRRVEFRVVWEEGARPEGIEPEPNPTMPEYVDEAPPDRRDR